MTQKPSKPLFLSKIYKRIKIYFERRETINQSDPRVILEFTGQQLYDSAKGLNLPHPFFCISGHRYLPGEEVKCFLTDDKGKIEKEFAVIPNPVEWKSTLDNAKIEIILGSVNPVMYSIILDEFQENEAITFSSVSKNESIKSSIHVSPFQVIGVLPAVIGHNGGLAKYSLERSNGEKISFILPWGDEFISIIKTGFVSENDAYPKRRGSSPCVDILQLVIHSFRGIMSV